jgi:N-acetylmuramoyl-L-alanine amidase
MAQVVLEIGHGEMTSGGKDLGAYNSRLKVSEYERNKLVAYETKKVLEKEGYTVQILDFEGKSISLENIATHAEDDSKILVSIHHNSASANVQGFEVFILEKYQDHFSKFEACASYSCCHGRIYSNQA